MSISPDHPRITAEEIETLRAERNRYREGLEAIKADRDRDAQLLAEARAEIVELRAALGAGAVTVAGQDPRRLPAVPWLASS